MGTLLFENHNASILREEGSILRVRRSAAPTRIDEIASTARELERLAPPSIRPRLGLLLDMRLAPALDPKLEAEVEPLVARLSQGFGRRAVLLATPFGRLQANRTVRTMHPDPAAILVTLDEEEALSFLRGVSRSSLAAGAVAPKGDEET